MRRFFLFGVFLMSVRGQDVDNILQRNREADKQNDEHAKRYTYVSEADHFEYDKKGQARKDHSETHDVIFVEGEAYERLVARDGKPLPPRQEVKEEKKMQQTAEQRRKERRSGLFHRSLNISGEDLLKLCDHRLLGEEEIRGRKAWVIEYTPQAGRVAANQHEKDVLSFQTKVWVDEAESTTVKLVLLATGDGTFMKPGSTMTIELAKINHDAWLPVFTVFDARIQIAVVFRDSMRIETRNSNFKKFDVESTITVADR